MFFIIGQVRLTKNKLKKKLFHIKLIKDIASHLMKIMRISCKKWRFYYKIAFNLTQYNVGNWFKYSKAIK